MNKQLKTWVKVALIAIAGVALLDLWRNWAWAKRLAAALQKNDREA